MHSLLRICCSALVVVVLLGALGPSTSLASPAASFAGRWIDVDVSAHRATAYEGDTPVRVLPITAGKPGYETPLGTFYIFARVASDTMSSESLGVSRNDAEGYYLKDVRYVQYFAADGVALHANYWQPDYVFGQVNTSHGCVGLREADAAYLWRFADYGTPVVVHRGDGGAALPAVPSAVGKPLAEAKAALEAARYQVQVTEVEGGAGAPGVVLTQAPAAGAALARGGVVALTVRKAPAVRAPAPVRPPEGDWAWVPEIVGLSEFDAARRIEAAGLSTTYTNYQVEGDVPEGAREFFRSIAPGHVLSSQPVVGERMPRGSVVKFAVRKQ